MRQTISRSVTFEILKKKGRAGRKFSTSENVALITISTIELKHIDLRFRLLLKGRSLPFTLSATLLVLMSQDKFFRTLKFLKCFKRI